MRPIGFSSGALAKGDYQLGIDLQRAIRTTAVELSALRENELAPLIAAIPSLDLAQFSYVSLHAPSKLKTLSERELLDALRQIPKEWPVVVHPDLIQNIGEWRQLGSQLCIENMDDRKPTGRTVAELKFIFEQLPDAGFCFDAGHARQIDPTLAVAINMLKQFGDRLRQLHISEVGAFGEHLPVSNFVKGELRRVVKFIPRECPVILESIVSPTAMESELSKVLDIFA
jgi:hypothetical protein